MRKKGMPEAMERKRRISRIRKISAYIPILLCIGMLFAPVVQAKGTSVKAVSSGRVKLSSKKLKLKQNKTKRLKLKNTSKEIVWKSSDRSVAMVSQRGVVKAKQAGICTITAKAGGRKYQCKVTVYNISPKVQRCRDLQMKHNVAANRKRILLAGSSSIGRWKDAPEVFAPYEVLNMGIGGSMTRQWLKWYKKLIVAYDPIAVILYPGVGNELKKAKSADRTAAGVCRLLKLLHRELPGVPIFYVSTYCNYNKQKVWELEKSCNKMVKKYCGMVEDLYYIDVAESLVNKRGTAPKWGVISDDGEHMNKSGYAIWNSIIVPKVKERLEFKETENNT